MFVRSYSARLSWNKLSKKSLLVLFVLESLKAKTALPFWRKALEFIESNSFQFYGRTVVSHSVLRMSDCQSSGAEGFWGNVPHCCDREKGEYVPPDKTYHIRMKEGTFFYVNSEKSHDVLCWILVKHQPKQRIKSVKNRLNQLGHII